MIDIEKPKIEIAEISEDNRYGKFICEPLERGYGTTFGNSLRRMLLSSLEGAAITSIRIDGVLHEFSTIPGVRDDVTNIVLNLKQLCLKMQGSEPRTISIDVEVIPSAGDAPADILTVAAFPVYVDMLVISQRVNRHHKEATMQYCFHPENGAAEYI